MISKNLFNKYMPLIGVLLIYLFWSTYIDEVKNLRPFLKNSYPGFIESLKNQNLIEILLPQKALTGSYSSTGLILFQEIESFFSSTGIAYQFCNCLMLILLFFTINELFKSKFIATTSCFVAALSTHNYHIFSISGSGILPLVSTYFLGTFLFLSRFIKTGKIIHLATYSFFLILFALSYEGWLDYFCWSLICLPFALYYYRREKQSMSFLLMATSVQFLVFFVYLFIKIKFGYGQQNGSESDVIFNYPNLVIQVEDLIGNIFKQSFLTISNFIPPLLTGSNSLILFSKEWIIEQQHGYHPEYSNLVYMNHLFLWRFYAGFIFAFLLILILKNIKNFLSNNSLESLASLCLIIAIPFGSATHTITKFRPFNSVPFLGYHVWFSILISCIGLAFALELIAKKISPAKRKWLIAVFFLNIILCALFKPTYLSQMSEAVGTGKYSTPIDNLKRYINEKH